MVSLKTPILLRKNNVILQTAWLVLAGLAVLLVVLNQPAHLRGLLNEWSVEQAASSLPTSISDETFTIYFLVLRYFCLGLCWLAAGIIFIHRRNFFPALATAAAFWFVPLTFGLAGDLTNATYPYSWHISLKMSAQAITALGLVSFVTILFIFPDGRFKPGWMKYILLLTGLLTGASFVAIALPISLSGEWMWPVFFLSFMLALIAGTVSQVIRFRIEPDPSKQRQGKPFMVFAMAFLLLTILSVSGVVPQSGLSGLLAIHGQILLLGAFAVSIMVSIRREQLWGIEWSPNPFLLGASGAVLLALLAWWVAAPVLRQIQLAAQREVVVSHVPGEPKIPLIYDTDLAQDDYLALLYLLQHPAVELKAITVAGTGETHCDPGVGHVLSVLDLTESDDIQVTCGRETPLKGSHAFPAEWRAGVDDFFGIKLPMSQRQPAALSAPELMAELLRNSPEPISILAVGPLTNIGELLLNYPDLTSKISRIYVMGGAVRTGGNVWVEDTTIPFAEWNIYVDPYAANVVLQSGVPVTLVPLDATNFVPVERAFKRRLAGAAVTPAARLASQLLATLSPEAGPYHFWDTLAAAIVTDPSVAYFQNAPLSVIEEEGPYSGQTAWVSSGTITRYASGASQPHFEGLLLAVLNQP